MTNNLTADASPEKRLFISLLTRDISLVAAFLDLIDNSINAALAPYADKLTTAEGYLSALDDPEISASTSIDIEFSAESVKITDNAAGIDSETARSYVFKFGRAARTPARPLTGCRFTGSVSSARSSRWATKSQSCQTTNKADSNWISTFQHGQR